MKNCLILGSGRSGTSMVAGMLRQAGYFMGENLHAPNPANPKGFFEDMAVNLLNEALLAPHVPKRPPLLGRWLFRSRPIHLQRWLAVVDSDANFDASSEQRQRMAELTARQPFCFKDPRFCYTLPAWRPYLAKAVFVCVFRHPAATVESILRECREAEYLRSLQLTRAQAYAVWHRMYRAILDRHRQDGAWLFLHYEQAFTDDGVRALANHTGAAIDGAFAERDIGRTRHVDEIAPADILATYRDLCVQAAYALPNQEPQ